MGRQDGIKRHRKEGENPQILFPSVGSTTTSPCHHTLLASISARGLVRRQKSQAPATSHGTVRVVRKGLLCNLPSQPALKGGSLPTFNGLNILPLFIIPSLPPTLTLLLSELLQYGRVAKGRTMCQEKESRRVNLIESKSRISRSQFIVIS